MSTEQAVFTYENAKTVKGEKLGWLTAIRYLAPADESGVNVCPNAGACKAVCLYTAGRGIFASTQAARVLKTWERIDDRDGQLDRASREVVAAQKRAAKLNVKLAVRMNGTSDLSADAIDLARRHPDVQFYDYTKNVGVMRRYLRGDLPANYHLTLSYDPVTVPWDVVEELAHTPGPRSFGVAVCFNTRRNAALPSMWNWWRVIDGDEHDLRFLDAPPGTSAWVVGLRAKGAARKPGLSAFTVVLP
jgi:hypothetical protein